MAKCPSKYEGKVTAKVGDVAAQKP
jgi:hypothetical protein